MSANVLNTSSGVVYGTAVAANIALGSVSEDVTLSYAVAVTAIDDTSVSIYLPGEGLVNPWRVIQSDAGTILVLPGQTIGVESTDASITAIGAAVVGIASVCGIAAAGHQSKHHDSSHTQAQKLFHGITSFTTILKLICGIQNAPGKLHLLLPRLNNL